jgi:predicted nucleic acid binding AN1-type Zn finger protein
MDWKKKRCGHCQKPVLIWVECSLCQKSFCIHDRAPEAHLCEKLEAYRKRPMDLSSLEKIFTPKMEYIE